MWKATHRVEAAAAEQIAASFKPAPAPKGRSKPAAPKASVEKESSRKACTKPVAATGQISYTQP